jgi:hypothetical protein
MDRTYFSDVGVVMGDQSFAESDIFDPLTATIWLFAISGS